MSFLQIPPKPDSSIISLSTHIIPPSAPPLASYIGRRLTQGIRSAPPSNIRLTVDGLNINARSFHPHLNRNKWTHIAEAALLDRPITGDMIQAARGESHDMIASLVYKNTLAIPSYNDPFPEELIPFLGLMEYYNQVINRSISNARLPCFTTLATRIFHLFPRTLSLFFESISNPIINHNGRTIPIHFHPSGFTDERARLRRYENARSNHNPWIEYGLSLFHGIEDLRQLDAISTFAQSGELTITPSIYNWLNAWYNYYQSSIYCRFNELEHHPVFNSTQRTPNQLKTALANALQAALNFFQLTRYPISENRLIEGGILFFKDIDIESNFFSIH